MQTPSVPSTLLVTIGGWKEDLGSLLREERDGLTFFTQNHVGSLADHNFFRTELANLYFRYINTIHLWYSKLQPQCIWLFIYHWFSLCKMIYKLNSGRESATSLGEMLQTIYIMGGWGQSGFSKRKQSYGGAWCFCDNWQVLSSLRLFWTPSQSWTTQRAVRKTVLCPERNPSPLTLAFMVIWAQKVERANFPTPKAWQNRDHHLLWW